MHKNIKKKMYSTHYESKPEITHGRYKNPYYQSTINNGYSISDDTRYNYSTNLNSYDKNSVNYVNEKIGGVKEQLKPYMIYIVLFIVIYLIVKFSWFKSYPLIPSIGVVGGVFIYNKIY